MEQGRNFELVHESSNLRVSQAGQEGQSVRHVRCGARNSLNEICSGRFVMPCRGRHASFYFFMGSSSDRINKIIY